MPEPKEKEYAYFKLELPIVLYRRNGESFCSIWASHGMYHYHYSGLDPDEYESYDFTHLIETLIGRVHDKNVELRCEAEDYRALQKALHKALRTPWNNL